MGGLPGIVVVLEFAGVLAFALDGGLSAVRDRRLDVVGVFTLALLTALGGGMIRDALLGATPAAALVDWRYVTAAFVGGALAWAAARVLERLGGVIAVVDAVGLSLFAVTGAAKALDHGLDTIAVVLLGTVSAVGGGMIRDVCLLQVPAVLRRDTVLYAIPAMLGATILVVAVDLGGRGWPWPVLAAGVALTLRLVSMRWNITAPPGSLLDSRDPVSRRDRR